jgi:ERF superfamily
VRKTLGQHEIATVQTTAIDQAAGLVNLTTMLAHASGEWIASDWPVCPIAEMGNPQRMGAALTYARRYALFTLVGIAGEDDLDAPDLCAVPSTTAKTGMGSGELRLPSPSDGNGGMRAAARVASTPFLSSDESAALRDRLLGEIVSLQSEESATNWAQGALAAKNKLTASDSKLLEESFEKRLSALLPSERAEVANVLPPQSGGHEIGKIDEPKSDQGGIDKSVLTVAAPRRYRNRDHLRFVMQQPCLLCGRKPSDAHHIRFVQPRALGRKPSDEFAVPLCRSHHRAAHRAGDEKAWWKQADIDPIKVARKLWKHTRIDEGRIEPEPTAQGATADRSAESDALAVNSQTPT